jgi:acetyl esterase
LLAKQRRGPELAFQLLFYPIMGRPDPSAQRFDTPWMTTATLCRAIEAAFPDAASRILPTAFPLDARLDDLNDLPPALIIVAEADPLCTQGEAYARRLIQAGVQASASRYLGTIHDFVSLNALAASPATRGAIAQATAALRAALYGP